MRITWVTRSFLDYRIPVYQELNKFCKGNLTVIYYRDIPPQRTQKKIKDILGEKAIAREKEFRIGNKPKIDNASKSNTSFRIPVSPGLIKQVINSKPDVLISDGFMQWTYATLAVRALKKIPHVMCYERTMHTERNAGKLRIWYRKFVSRWIDAIACNGSLCGEYVRSLGFDSNRLTFGHMVADVSGMSKAVENVTEEEITKLKRELCINSKSIIILFVGQLIPIKGVNQLLTAWKQFKTQNTEDCTLVYVGYGHLEESLRNRVINENIQNVILTGGIDYDSIAKYYKAANCFILPTIEDNWSLVVPEAMACSLPIATTIYNGCYPELVTQENGWIFDTHNEQSIIDTLQKIILNKNRLKKMGEESKKIVSKHTAEKAAQSIINAIDIAQKHCKNKKTLEQNENQHTYDV